MAKLRALVAALLVLGCGSGESAPAQVVFVEQATGGSAGDATVVAAGGPSTGSGGQVTSATGGNSGETQAGSSAGGATAGLGGSGTGGMATGGSATGGIATGGKATGGAASGGQALGGSATGGASSGGNAIGGTATGGEPSSCCWSTNAIITEQPDFHSCVCTGLSQCLDGQFPKATPLTYYSCVDLCHCWVTVVVSPVGSTRPTSAVTTGWMNCDSKIFEDAELQYTQTQDRVPSC